MRTLGWFLIGTLLVTTTGCGGCSGGGASMAEMKRRAIRRNADEDEETPPPPPSTLAVETVTAETAEPQPAVPEKKPAAPKLMETDEVEAAPPKVKAPPKLMESDEVDTAPPQARTPPKLMETDEVEAAPPKVAPPKAATVPPPQNEVASVGPLLPLPNATRPDSATPTGPLGDPLAPDPSGNAPALPLLPVVDTRQEVPDAEAQRAGKRLLAELYRSDYENARTPAQKLALAHRLLAKAVEMEGDAVGHYLLLNLIQDLAIKSGDVATSIQTLDTLATHYKVDSATLKFKALETLSKSLRTGADTNAYLQECAQVLHQALENDDFDLGTRAHEIALVAAKRGNKQAQILQLTTAKKVLEEAKAAYGAVPAARSTLIQDPTHAEAHLSVGRYLCFYHRDWEQGLLHLSQASDVKLKVLAQIDRSEPTQAQQQADLGDQWYDLAVAARPYAQQALAARAGHWYALAIGSLPSGLAKARVQKRLQEIAELTGDPALQNPR